MCRSIHHVETSPPTIGTELRRVRDSMGLTLVDFGKLIGLPWQTLQAYEAERCTPPADRLLIIVHATRRAPEPFRWEHVARSVARAADPVARAA